MRYWLALVMLAPLGVWGLLSRPSPLSYVPSAVLIVAYLLIILHFSAAAAVGRLRHAMGDARARVWFIVVSNTLPLVNLLLMPIDASDAARVLGQAFGRVPALGFTDAQLRRARDRCSRCGYPLAGLPSAVCPECGFIKTPPSSTG
jgi:hypothetical protein